MSRTRPRACRRPSAATRARLRRAAAALGFSALATLVLVAVAGRDPLAAGRALATGAFGSRAALASGLDRATPYMLAGAGVALCFRAGVINIGAEGQIALGGLGAASAAIALGPASPLLALPGALVCGAIAGALWSGLAAALHLFRGVHEVLATLLTNFIALLLVQLVLAGPLGEVGAGFLQSPPIPRAARLPFVAAFDAHAGLGLAVLASAGASALLWRTRFGFSLRLLGASRVASRYAGDDPRLLVGGAMLLAGALAGLAGAVEVLGLHRRLVEGFSLGFGFRAVSVALLALLEPLAVIPAALAIGFLETGASAMQRAVGVPSALVVVLEAAVVLSVLAATAAPVGRTRA